MAVRVRGRFALLAIALILVGIFVPPLVNLNRYRGRIGASISNAIGRRTTIGSVSLRLLPQPGFDLGNVTVADDPAFGAEPMLHADEVTANLRLTSLWRGRLEIAKLRLQYPSLNLVRAQDGRWNVENLLEHASRIPAAPTTKSRPESRIRFPYVEADAGRINFKIGSEKKVYSLADADFSLWLESETELRTHLAARMVRTDSYLSDTGMLKLDGRFQRAWNLRETPLAVSASLQNAQLGQLTKLLDGLDSGWRGTVALNLVLGGTPSNMTVSAQAAIDDFRRYDITSIDHTRLQARCTAKFSAPAERFSDVDCQSVPSADGVITVRGAIDGIAKVRSYDLAVSAKKMPVQQLLSLAHQTKKGIPDDLTASGFLDASFAFRKANENSPEVWEGTGQSSDIALRSSVLTTQLVLKPVQFALQSPTVPSAPRLREGKVGISQPVGRGPNGSKNVAQAQLQSDYRLSVLPFAVPAGASAPISVSGWFGLNGYKFSVDGDSEIPRLLQVAQIVGIRTPQLNANGSAKINLSIAGNWAGFQAPMPTGTAQIRSVNVRMKGIASPLQITSANLVLRDDFLLVSNLAASFTDSRVALTGSVRVPRQCESIADCPIQFDFHSDQLSTDDLNRLFNPRVARRPWYAILGRGPEPSLFTALNATGHFTVGHVAIKSAVANRVSTDARLQDGKLSLSNLEAELWGGRHRGQWTADFTQNQPVYSGTGTFESVTMPALLALVKDNWASGNVRARYTASANGFTASELSASASASIEFDWQKGSFRYLSLTGSNAPFSFSQFSGTATLHSGKLALMPASKLTSPSGIYVVSGTASLARQIDLTFRDGKRGYLVTGTIAKPKVTSAPVSETQASLQQ